MPIVTIAIPYYNDGYYLKECLKSIINQSYTNWEAIVVDDCSILRDAESIILEINDPRVCYVRHDKNMGLAASRNTGFRLSKTPYIIALDADDMLPAFTLEIMVAFLESNNDCSCIYGNIQLFGTENTVWKSNKLAEKELTQTQWIPGSGTMMKKQLWESVGGYCEDETLRLGNEDWDFWLSAITKNINVFYVDNILYLYRRRSGSLSQTLIVNDYKTREYIYKRHKHLFDKYLTGNIFIYTGYVNSIKACMNSHKFITASLLFCRSLKYSKCKNILLKNVLHYLGLLNISCKIKSLLNKIV